MKPYIALLLLAATLAACTKVTAPKPKTSITGTWKLIAATSTEKDSTYSTFNAKNEMIKIINDSHFAFFNHDLQHGKDSTTASYSAGGGTYTLTSDSIYTEHLQYFNDRAWEDHKFTFTVKVSGDTLTQKGLEKLENLGIDRIIVEKYVRF